VPSRLKQLRMAKELTQDEAARAVGISRPFFTQLERGSRSPSFDVAVRIARFFNVPVERVFLPMSVAIGNVEGQEPAAPGEGAA